VKRKLALVVTVATAVAGFIVFDRVAAEAHACTEPAPQEEPTGKKPKKKDPPPPPAEEECGPTDVYPNWRDNVVPLFDLEDRDDEQQKRDAQRWRDENGCETQFCIWANPSGSVDDEAGPATFHAGMAGEHALGEAAHSDEGHTDDEFGNHDSHGGTIYADVCLGTDAGTSYEDNAGACEDIYDSQVGIVIVDHLTCPAGCADEYHVIRPTDPAFTRAQLEDSQRDIGEIAADPQRYACGYEEQGSACYG
jgi:hypothetical protein